MTLKIWWEPVKFAVYRKGKWCTLTDDFILKKEQIKTVSVSPIGKDGLVYFIAFDIDSGNPSDVQTLLRILPEPSFVSVSGSKGWHIWIFPSRPLKLETALGFAKIVRKESCVKCEIFPNSRRSKCIKWLQSVHPVTGIIENFIDKTSFSNDGQLSTEMILNEISLGMHRVSVESIDSFIKRNINYVETKSINKKVSSLASDPKLALGLAKLCNRNVERIGEAFLCILPGHKDRSPSAAFYTANNGTIVYHDFHYEKYGNELAEFLTLGEVYASIITHKVKKLNRVEAARWLAKLAIHLNHETKDSRELKIKLFELHELLCGLGVLKTTGEYKIKGKLETNVIIQNMELQALNSINTYLKNEYIHNKTKVSIKKNREMPSSDYYIVGKVWRTFCYEAVISILSGFKEVKLSSRFLARGANVPLNMANRAINFLCTIGVIEKVHGSGGKRGDRFNTCNVKPEEVKKRFLTLFPDGQLDLRVFNRNYVVEKLSENIAKQVFRNRKGT